MRHDAIITSCQLKHIKWGYDTISAFLQNKFFLFKTTVSFPQASNVAKRTLYRTKWFRS